MTSLDRNALRQGAMVCLCFAVPFSVGSSIVHNHDNDSPWVAVLWLGALGGFTLGGGIAAWLQRTGYPLLHGMVCAGGTYLVAQGAFTVIRLARGADVSWLPIFFTFTVVVFGGVVGGGLGGALRKRGIYPGARGTS